jgi:ACS family hexuronate transporter-like MFS transporter
MVPWILAVWGWQVAFMVTGGVGFIWVIFWVMSYDKPTTHKSVTPEELAYIQSDEDEVSTSDEKPVKWAQLLEFVKLGLLFLEKC